MKKLSPYFTSQNKIISFGFLLVVLFCHLVVYAGSVDENSAKISGLLKNAVYKNDPNLEIIKFEYKPESRSEGGFKGKVPTIVKEGWRTNIALKNHYQTKVRCAIEGKFLNSKGMVEKSIDAVDLFNGDISPETPDWSLTYTSGFVVNLRNVNNLASFQIETICEPLKQLTQEESDSKILNILNKATYKKDPGIKVLEINYKKVSTDAYSDNWASAIKVKSCYTMNVICSGSGVFEGGSGYFGVLPQSRIDKLATLETTGVIKVLKEDIDTISSFEVSITCNPIYSEHSNKYSGDDPYWKQFLPKNNDCR